MRKIKFRLWDVEEKCFMNHSHVIEIRVLALENNGEGRFIFQQWTGLLDRQGREIYEGDILHIKTKKGYEHIGNIGVIRMSHTAYVVGTSTGEYLVVYCDELEVIGNIFENHELLLEEN